MYGVCICVTKRFSLHCLTAYQSNWLNTTFIASVLLLYFFNIDSLYSLVTIVSMQYRIYDSVFTQALIRFIFSSSIFLCIRYATSVFCELNLPWQPNKLFIHFLQFSYPYILWINGKALPKCKRWIFNLCFCCWIPHSDE